jgi:hypothetical protein
MAAGRIIFLDFMAVRMFDGNEVSIYPQQGCPSENDPSGSEIVIGSPSLVEERWGFLSTLPQRKDQRQ